MEKFLQLLLWCRLLLVLSASLLPYILGIIAGLFVLHTICPGIPPKYALIGFLMVTIIVVGEVKGILNNKK
jgi:hypothetical protein